MRWTTVLGMLGFAWSLPAQANLDADLLRNGDAESPEAMPVAKATFDTPGWSVEQGGLLTQTGKWQGVSAGEGKRFFRGDDVARTEAVQDVVLATVSGGRPPWLIARGLVRSQDGSDTAELRISLLDAQGKEITAASTGARRDKKWVQHRLIVPVPSSAVIARVALVGVRRAGKNCGALFDALALEPVGRGFPASLAGSPASDLVEGHRAAPDETRRRAFLAALAADGGSEAVRYLTACATEDKDATRQQAALEFLALSGSRGAVEPIEARLTAGSSTVRAHTLGLIHLVPFEWRDALARIAIGSKDAATRKQMLARLARDGDGAGLQRLSAIYREGDPARKLEVLQAMYRRYDAADILGSFLEPNLKKKGVDARLRHEAMRHLAAARHPLFLSHFDSLYGYEPDRARRKTWLAWCGEQNHLDALGLMIQTVLDKDPAADGAMLDAIAGMKSKKIGSWVRRNCVTAREPLLRRVALRFMAVHPWPGDIDELYRACRDPDEDLARTAIDALGASDNPRAAEVLARFLDRTGTGRSGIVQATALRALWETGKRVANGAVPDDVVRRAVTACTESPAWQVRATAIDLLKSGHTEVAREALLAAVTSPTRQVRTAAYEALTMLRDRESIDVLIGRLGEEKTFVAHHVADCLADLTGVNLGIDADTWQRWWHKVRESFVCPPKPARDKRASATARTKATYHGIPVRADNIVFVIDLSGSMTAKIKGKTRLDLARQELIDVLEALGPRRRFGIIAFSGEPRAYASRLKRATKGEVRKATRWLEKLRAGGATNIYDSLDLAMQMGDVESVFLLSDGGPTAGKIVGQNDILRVVRRDNAYLQVRINTITIGGSSGERGFMKRLADQNSGVSRKK